MKVAKYIFVCSLLFLMWGNAGAMTIEPYIDPGHFWDVGGTPTLYANSDFTIEIRMDNPDGFDRAGFSIPFAFYMTGDVTSWTNVGYEGLNGFEAGSPWWVLYNQYEEIDWDGVAADTINWTGGGISGFPNGEPLATRLAYAFRVDMEVGETATFCIDSCSVPNTVPEGKFDWLFEEPSPSFGGPHCWPVESSYLPPQFTNCPTADIQGQFDTQFLYDFDAQPSPPPASQDLTYEVSSGPGTIDPVTGVWTFSPDCGDVGSHTVEICVADDIGSSCCTFTITVLNTPPVISSGPCNEQVKVGIERTTTFDFDSEDLNVGDVISWSVNAPGFVGYYSIDNEGILTIIPEFADEGDWTFYVRATDCAGAYAECEVYVTVLSITHFEVYIDIVEDQLQGHHGFADIILQESTEILHGFDFLIGYDPSVLNFVAAMPGAIFDIPGGNEWEYFTYRYNYNGNCGAGCPSGLLRVIGMAEYNDGGHHPVLEVLPAGTVLFTLDFLVSSDYNVGGSFAPINFYWMDCGDNAIAYSYRSEGTLAVMTGLSDKVYMYNGNPFYDITDPGSGFPTYTGAQTECYENPQPGKPTPVPFVNFYGGGIDIIDPGEIDDRGDVNMNNVPYEIADAVVFTNYFIYGMAAFTVSIEGQKAATEINGDGIALTVADLVYLIRVIVGDAMPLPKIVPESNLNVFAGGNNVTVDGEIGAAYFVFDGPADVSPGEGAAGMELRTNIIDGNTVALLYTFKENLTASGVLLETSSIPVSVEAADYNGNAYRVAILPADFKIRNYPNPFNPVTTIEMSLPVASDWNITIFNVAGREVASFDGFSSAGIVDVVWDASKFATGVYFYKARAGNFSATEKLMLVK